ncbi:MAG: hypothetical protein QG658_251 [Patescibacteria group bacterium]|nr:hypothetical protein [Patescibacteria group bacterium]
MAISPVCDLCRKKLKDFGALLFSPPNKKANVKKFHVCKPCYKNLLATYSLEDIRDQD